MTDSEKDTFGKIEDVLKSKDVEYKENVVVGKARPDFYIETPVGTTHVFEVKAWKPTHNNLLRANKVADLNLSTGGTSGSFVIIEDGIPYDANSNVVPISSFPQYIDNLINKGKEISPKKLPKVEKAPDKFIFAAMPFDGNYDDTFKLGILPAALACGVDAFRSDQKFFSGDIVAKIRSQIRKSIGVIADLSQSKPNVFYEIGYAHGRGRKIIQISSTKIKEVPFDRSHNQVHKYLLGQAGTTLKDLLLPIICSMFGLQEISEISD